MYRAPSHPLVLSVTIGGLLIIQSVLPSMPMAWGASLQQARDTTRTREVQIVRADSLVGSRTAGEQRLVGNVYLIQEQTHLWADQATRYPDRAEIIFDGNVLIVDEGDSLRADHIIYDTDLKIGRATGEVRLSDGEMVAYAPSGLYFVDEKRSAFEEGVRLVDSVSVLTSVAGAYWTDEKRAEFYGDVHLVQPETSVEADSVTFYRETRVALARGDVFMERFGGREEDAEPDSTVRTLLFGNDLYSDERTAYSRVEGDPLLVQLRRDSTGTPTDTLALRALILEASRLDSLEKLTATRNVRVWQADLSAVSDSLVYDRIETDSTVLYEETRLYGSPVAWIQQSQLEGDTVRVVMRSGSIDTVFVRQNAFVAQLDSVLQRIQQLQGGNATAVFANDSLRTLDVRPNAEMIYYLADDQQQPDGAVQTSGDRALFRFQGGKLARVSVIGGTEGTYHAEEILPEDLQLSGYSWRPDDRPTREEFLSDERVQARLRTPPDPEIPEGPPEQAAPIATEVDLPPELQSVHP